MADYYYNPGNPRKGIAAGTGTTGNNTTVGNAYADLADLINKWKNGTSGNRFFIRCGSMQQVNALYFSSGLMLCKGRGNLISYYGDTETTEDWFATSLYYEAPAALGWSNTPGTNRWSKTFPTPDANGNTSAPANAVHVWRQARMGDYPREFGPDTGRVSTAAEVTSEDKFHCVPATPSTGMVLTMYTPNGTAPPDYFGGLALQSRAGTGGGNANNYWSADCVFVANNQDCEFRRMATMGGKTRIYAYSSGGADLVGDNLNLLFRDCSAVMGEYGVQVLNQANTVKNYGLEFVDQLVNFYSDSRATTVAAPDDRQYEDGVFIQGYAEAIKFSRLTMRASRHAGVAVVPESSKAPDSSWPRGIVVAGYDYDSVHGSYGHPLAMTCDGWTVTDAVMRNVANQSQLAGIGTLSRFRFVNMLPYPDVPGGNNYGDDNAICINNNGSGVTLSTVKSIKLSFGVIDNPANFAIWIGEQTAQTVVVENLVIADLTYGTSKRMPSQTSAVSVPAAPVMHRNSNTGSQVDPQIFRNNVYLLPPGQTACHVRDTDTTFGISWAQSNVNVLSGHAGNAMYTSLAAATLDANYRPIEGSALPLDGNVTSTGHVDADGMIIPTGQALPIGAFAGKPLRTLAVLA